MKRLYLRVLLFHILLTWLPGVGYAEDWPQFLGPRRNGSYAAEVAVRWPQDGPQRLWTFKAGAGFSAPVVSGERAFLFHRVESQETLDCLRAETGEPLWSQSYPTSYVDDFGFDEGPRATPSVASGRVVTFGAEGKLTCRDLEGGKRLWQVDTLALLGARKGYFGAASSPLVTESLVLLQVGGTKGRGIAAFDLSSGAVRWTATDHEAGYSSPVVATISKTQHGLFFTREGLVDLDPKTGNVRFSMRWRARISASVNAAAPIVLGDRVFVSASYGTGAAVVELGKDAGEVVWSSADVLSCHYATPVLKDGYLYGFDGRQEHGPRLRAVNFATGEVAWTRDGVAAGTITLAGDTLLVLTERGELISVAATPEAFHERARTTVLSRTVRAHPALAHGRFYARNENTLVCVDLRATPRKPD